MPHSSRRRSADKSAHSLYVLFLGQRPARPLKREYCFLKPAHMIFPVALVATLCLGDVTRKSLESNVRFFFLLQRVGDVKTMTHLYIPSSYKPLTLSHTSSEMNLEHTEK